MRKCKFKGAWPRAPLQWAVLQVADAKTSSKGHPRNTTVTPRGCKSKVVAKAIGHTKEPLVNGVDTTFRTKAALKTIRSSSNIEKNTAWGYPVGGPKLELAAKMAQDASKSDF